MSTGSRIIEVRLLQTLIWNLKVKFMGVVIGQGTAVSLMSNWLTFFLLYTNLTNNSWYTIIWNVTLKNPRSGSWVRSKLHSSPGIQPMHFVFFVMRKLEKLYLWDMANRAFELVKLEENFERKNIAGNKVSNRLYPKYNKVTNIASGI